jgi:DNA-directed RNA polymerase specialized sigma subunit
MNIDKQELTELISNVVKETIAQLNLGSVGSTGNVAAEPPKPEKTAYQKTEQLLFNYVGFKRIVEERMQEIEDIKLYGVPKKGSAVVEYGGNVGGTVQGIVLPEESVERAVENVVKSVQGTVQAIALIDKCMATLKNDPYYPILEMRYFEGRTQEDIAYELKCTQKTISQNKGRLVRELAMRLFPDQVIGEMLH